MHAGQNIKSGDQVTQLMLETFRLNGLLLAAGDRLTQDLGLTSALWQVMGAIAHEPLHMAQIARNMGLTRQSVRRTVHVLEKRGLVDFIENRNHKRAMLVDLTEQGRGILKKVTGKHNAWSDRIAENFSPDDLEKALQISRALSRLVQEPIAEGEST